jgi:ligand-binding SRPBCC domain-containing protein
MTPKLPQINFASADAKLDGASTVKQEQFIARPRDEVFAFFSEPRNLERLTPPWLNFEIVEIPEQLSEGALIKYRLRLHGVTINWTTRIQEWQPAQRFVDTQIAGPYSMWHHTHEFEEVEGGTLVRDLVRYRVPFGPFGEVIRRAMVAPDTKKIFEYRREMLEAEFS